VNVATRSAAPILPPLEHALPNGDPPVRPLALAAVAVTVMTWGVSNIVVKAIAADPLVSSFYRLWLAIPLLWSLPLLLPRLRSRLTRDWLVTSAVGGALFAVHQIFFFNSLKLTSVADVTLIGALQPALVLLVAGRLFGEPVDRRAGLWSAVAVAGTALVILGSMGAPHWTPLGDVLSVFNLLAFTAYFLASKRFRGRVGATEYVIGMTTVAGVLMLAVVVATGRDLLSPHGRDWPLLLFLALFPGSLGHLLSNWAHPHMPAFLLSVLLLAVPVIAVAGAAMLLGEHFTLLQAAGATILLGAIWTILRSAGARTAEDLAESAAETDAP